MDKSLVMEELPMFPPKDRMYKHGVMPARLFSPLISEES